MEEYGTRTLIVVRPDARGTWETVLEHRHRPTSPYLSRAPYEMALEWARMYSSDYAIPYTVTLPGKG
jgi:hypothetical protein